MSWRYLDRVDGIAIDNKDTRAHHQLISVDQQKNTLQYTVFYEPLQKQQLKPHISYSFIDDMNTDVERGIEQKNYLTKMYNDFFNAIRPHGKACGFQMRELAKALTFDIKFNQDLKMTDMTYRPTLGYMIKKMTYSDAKQQMYKSPDLKLMHDIVLNSIPKNKKKKDSLSFEDIVGRVSAYVQQNRLEIDFKENMDCISRSSESLNLTHKELEKARKMAMPEWADYMARYHSLRDHESLRDLPQDAVIPTTASREHIDHYNIMLAGETMVTGKSPFMEGTSAAIANFKKHQMVWQRLDI